MNKKNFFEFISVKQAIIFFRVSFIACMVSLLIWSFQADDLSWFFYSTQSTNNYYLGWVGSTMSSLLFFFLGGSAWVLAFLLWHLSYALYVRIPLRSIEDTFVGYVLLLFSLSALLRAYQIDYLNIAPGGLMGNMVYKLLLFIFADRVVALIGIYTSFMISIVLITQLSFTRYVQPLICFAQYIYHAKYVRLTCSTIVEFYQRIRKALDKRYLRLRVTKKEKNSFDRLLESIVQEELAYQQQPDDESFWQQFPILKNSNIESTQQVIFSPENSVEKVLKASPEKTLIQKPFVSANSQDAIENHTEQFYQLPPVEKLFNDYKEQSSLQEVNNAKYLSTLLEQKLERFGIQGTVVSIKQGPVLTLFEYEPHIDSKISKIIALEDDLALALQAMSIRIIAPIPGKSVVGFEVAHQKQKTVSFAALASSKTFKHFAGKLPLIIGHDVIGNDVIIDLTSLPHLLLAGSTGSGKSVALNGMLMSLLCSRTPDQLRLVLIDPKRLEFATYADIPHLLFPIVTEPKNVVRILSWLVTEMENRYKIMATHQVRNIDEYHKKMNNENSMPYIVTIIDELADLMMSVGSDIEDLIARIAQMARAAGIHLLVATQRPSVDVITGLIKVNFPCRISCKVASKVDSRTILDTIGADKLLGKGDMLFLDASSQIRRVHGAFVSMQEIEKIVTHIKKQKMVRYQELTVEQTDGALHDEDQQLYQHILSFIQTVEHISISSLQRQFRIGYNRSARFIDLLESQGHVLPSQGGKPRKVIKSIE